MEEFLAEANLNNLTDILKENDINDLDTLGELIAHPDELKNIITSVGLRMTLKKKYRDHIEAHNSTIQNLLGDMLNPDLNNPDLNFIQTQPEGIIVNNTQIDASTSDQIKILPFITCTQEDQNSEESGKKKRKRISNSTINFDLKSLLNGHPIAAALYKIGCYQKCLIPQHQSLLVNIICWELLKNERSVTNADYAAIAQQIVQVFPDECVETYYVAPVSKKYSKKNVSEISKGKLPDKYRNLSGIIREAARVGKLPKLITPNTEQAEDEVAAENSKLWLVHNRNAEEVFRHWDISFILRQRDIEEKKYVYAEDILNNWPILTEAKSFELIERDFEKKFPGSQDSFILEWNKFFSYLFQLKKEKLNNEDLMYKDLIEKDANLQPGDASKLNPDCITAIQFYLLASFMAPKANKIRMKSSNATDKLNFWKPSISESREGIIIQVHIPGDIKKVIDEKRSRLVKKGLRLQPHIVIIGKDLTDIKKSYVRIDSVSYELPSLLKAVDVLFKIYLVFNLPYPLECENFCYLIQWGVYNISTDFDAQIPFVFNIRNQIQKRIVKK